MNNIKHIAIITIFPNFFEAFLSTSIIKKALEKNKVKIIIINLRHFAENSKSQQIDDYPYGGGQGMVLKAPPIFAAIEDLKNSQDFNDSLVFLLSPQGKKWSQTLAYAESKSYKSLILICGHYEGVDERILSIVDFEVSIGDYVLTGGEIPAMIICDSIIRLLPGVIKDDSHINDSFHNNLLDYPVFTRPEVFNNMSVPKVLLSGNHKEINRYRNKMSFLNTYRKRPDLLKNIEFSSEQLEWVKEIIE